MGRNEGYISFVLGQLAGLRSLSSRRMFGGVGLYDDRVFFGLIADDTLYFKVGDSNRSAYETRRMPAFRPYRDRPEVSMTYFEVPADVLEESDELLVWAQASIEVARATPQRRARHRAIRHAAKKTRHRPGSPRHRT